MATYGPSELTPHEVRQLKAYLRRKNVKVAARDLGVTEGRLRNALCQINHKLGVSSALGAAEAMGWLSVPA